MFQELLYLVIILLNTVHGANVSPICLKCFDTTIVYGLILCIISDCLPLDLI